MRKIVAALLAFTVFSAVWLPCRAAPAAPPDAPKCYRTGLNGTVCLTIDDGFGRNYIQKILDTLEANDVRCTFFLIGDMLKLNQDLWRRAVADGDELCYHTMHHRQLAAMPDARVQADLDEWNRTLAAAVPGYVSPRLARFPGGGGENNPRLLKLFAKNGYKVIGWSIDMHVSIRHDPCGVISRHIESLTKANSIILIHFTWFNADALPHYIGWLKQHYTLSTVTQALGQSPRQGSQLAWQRSTQWYLPWYGQRGWRLGYPCGPYPCD